jgi:hypothetical protein
MFAMDSPVSLIAIPQFIDEAISLQKGYWKEHQGCYCKALMILLFSMKVQNVSFANLLSEYLSWMW